jgi:SAM-dependent methyltransferase
MDTRDIEAYVDPEVYDLYYAWLTDDIPFYVARAQAARGPVLEAGCGTGRVLIPTLQAGVDIDGLDIHPGMVEKTRKKAAALGLSPTIVVGDMRDFTMPRRYALITIPFRAFQHLLSTADQVAALRCIREHLEEGGALVFNVFFPSFEKLAQPDGEQTLEMEFPHPQSGLPVAMYATRTTDRPNQTLAIEREVVESDARGYAAKTHRDRFRMRWIWKPEMELLLGAAGFARWSVQGGFDGEPLDNDAKEMVWTAWKD